MYRIIKRRPDGDVHDSSGLEDHDFWCLGRQRLGDPDRDAAGVARDAGE